jgi:type II secretory pathway pseudopilin PulG
MITNAQYLVQRLAEAKEKMTNYSSDANAVQYWKGIHDAYHSILNEAFTDWCKPGTPGYYVWNENMSYDAALNASAPVEYIFNFIGGGWNTVHAKNMTEAIAKAKDAYSIEVDEKSFRLSTPEDLKSNLAMFY